MKALRAIALLVGMIAVMALMVIALKATRKDTPAHFETLHPGMTKQEVADTMGLPAVAGAVGGPSDVHAPVWNYRAGTVEFVGDKVGKLSPHLP